MVSIRRVRPDEGPAFRSIRLQAIGESPLAFGSTVADTEVRPPEYWEERVRSGAAGEDNVLLVAEDAGQWVGIVAGFVDDSAPVRRVDLVSMWVMPPYRQHGVGRDLIEQIIAWAKQRNAQQVVLWVTETNAPALALYQRTGFRDTGVTQPLPSHPHLVERKMVLSVQ